MFILYFYFHTHTRIYTHTYWPFICSYLIFPQLSEDTLFALLRFSRGCRVLDACAWANETTMKLGCPALQVMVALWLRLLRAAVVIKNHQQQHVCQPWSTHGQHSQKDRKTYSYHHLAGNRFTLKNHQCLETYGHRRIQVGYHDGNPSAISPRFANGLELAARTEAAELKPSTPGEAHRGWGATKTGSF